MKYRWAQALNRFVARHFLAAGSAPNMEGDRTGGINRIFKYVYAIRRVGKALKTQSTDAKTTQPAFASETVLTDLRVLATDQSTEDIKGKAAVAHTVTFEATPKQVEALEVASKLGSIALSLRGLPGSDLADASGALGDDGVPEQKGVRSVSHTWDSDVSPLIHHGPGSGETITVLRGQGGGDTKIDVTINNKASAPTPNPNGSGPEKLTGGS